MNASASIKPPYEAELVEVDGRVMLVLSHDMLARLGVPNGNRLLVAEQADGLSLRAGDPAFVEAMMAAEQIMHEDRDILAVLAK